MARIRLAREGPTGNLKANINEDLAWALGWSLVAVTLATAPYIAAFLLTPQGEVFSGLLSNPQDGNSYLAKLRQSVDGAWLFHLPYTAELHRGVPVYFFYILLGKVAGLFHLPVILVYHSARVVSGIFFLLSAHSLFTVLVKDRGVKRTAFFLLAFGSGLSWVTELWGYLGTDLTIPESNTFHTLFSTPHFAFSLGLLIWALLLFMNAVEKGSIVYGLGSGALAVAATVVQPFLFLTMALVAGVWGTLVVRAYITKLRVVLRTYALLMVLVSPFLVGAYLSIYNDPVVAQWTAQNITLSPPPWDYALGYGIPLLLAAAGVSTLWKGSNMGIVEGRFILLWLLLGFLLLYLPVNFQRRLSEGLHIPLSLAAGVGLSWLRSRVSLLPGNALMVAAVVLSVPTSILLPATAVLGALQLQEPFYIPQAEVQAYTWLNSNSLPSDVVLAGPVAGNQIPAWAGVRVVWGHPFETVDSQRKRSLVDEFFGGGLGPERAVKILTASGATMVYYGERERRLGRLPAGLEGVLEPVYENGPVEIFRVTSGM